MNHTLEKKWLLRLYVAGQSPHSQLAISNLKEICKTYLDDQYHIEVIDIHEQPQLAEGDEIISVPTLVRALPEPIRRVIGDLSDTAKVLIGLQLKPMTHSKD